MVGAGRGYGRQSLQASEHMLSFLPDLGPSGPQLGECAEWVGFGMDPPHLTWFLDPEASLRAGQEWYGWSGAVTAIPWS